MSRQELIDSLPHWLRERADELLREDAKTLADMPSWVTSDEGVYFWQDCHWKRYEEALKELKETRPEVYEKYYAKYFIEHDSVSITEIKEELNSIGSCAIVVCLALHEAGVPLPKEAENNIAVIKHRYEEVESKLKNL